MRRPNARIATAMLLISLVALNLGAVRAWYDLRSDGKVIDNRVETLTYGTLPMANLLIGGLLIGLGRSGRRPFLWGFEAFGAAALALFAVLAYFRTEQVAQPYVLWVLRSLPRSLRGLDPAVRVPIFYLIATLLVGLPQLAFALVGGAICRALLAGKPRL